MIRRRRAFTRVGELLAVLVTGASCGDEQKTAATTGPSTAPVTAETCVVRLHGKGGEGGASRLVDGRVEVRPNGNADGWGKRQWLYFPDARYDEARAVVAKALDEAGCSAAVINGFSNGASFAAKMYCRGETFDGRVVGYVIDDPVTDSAVLTCTPADGVQVALYWTGALAKDAPAGKDCAGMDWTCEGGSSIGIDAYAQALGVAVTPSPFTDHQPYEDAPEITAWLA
jgi:hypothetical protein